MGSCIALKGTVGYSKRVSWGNCRLMGKISCVGLIILLGAVGCAHRNLTQGEARRAIIGIPGFPLPQDGPLIQSITNMDNRQAVVEANIKTTFRLEKQGNEWMVVEVRLADGKWLQVEDWRQDLQGARSNRAQNELNLIALALERFRVEHQGYPEAGNMPALANILFPRYMNKMVSGDPWGNEYLYRRATATSFLVLSRGPDGKAETGDDLRAEGGTLN